MSGRPSVTHHLGPLDAGLNKLLKQPMPVQAARRAPGAASGSQVFC